MLVLFLNAVRVVEVLGTDLPIELFKKTQKIESEGGMMIMVCLL